VRGFGVKEGVPEECLRTAAAVNPRNRRLRSRPCDRLVNHGVRVPSQLMRVGQRAAPLVAAAALRVRPRLNTAVLALTEACDSRCRSCSFRRAAPDELGCDAFLPIIEELAALGTRTVALSGGEPLLVEGLPTLARHIGMLGMRATLLTNGLALAERAEQISGLFTEIIVSLDGWDGPSYRRLRGVDGFERVADGIRAVREVHAGTRRAAPALRARTTLQHGNASELEALVEAALRLGLDTISFLGVDPGPARFGRAHGRPALIPRPEEIRRLREGVWRLREERPSLFERGFIVERAEKLLSIADHLAAAESQGAYPAKQCNAPFVSVVIGPRGDVRPCFFKRPFGSVREAPLRELLTGAALFRIRATLNVARDEDCSPCVCPIRQPLRAVLLPRSGAR
jgi:MoaA/NifB/PqqE/SkfB family radical SAM enzyme